MKEGVILTALVELITTIIAGGLTAGEIFGLIGEFWKTVVSAPEIVAINDLLLGLIEPVFAFLPYIIMALYLVLALAGKRLFGIIRFLAFFFGGFVFGMYLLAPLVSGFLPVIPGFVTGLVAGLILAVLSKFLYFILIVAAPAGLVYLISYNGLIAPIAEFTQGNLIIAIVAAVVVAILVIVLLKYIEMLGTAFLGGWGIAGIAIGLIDDAGVALPAFLSDPLVFMLVVAGVITLIGFAVQVKTRKKY